MQKFLLTLLMLCVPTVLLAMPIQFAWDPAPGGEAPTGYRLYFRGASEAYDRARSLDVGALTRGTLDINLAIPAFVVVRAYNLVGESVNSNEVAVVVPDPPGVLRIDAVTLRLRKTGAAAP